MKITIDENLCIGCGTCESLCSHCFQIEDGVAKVVSDDCTECNVQDVANSCPAGAITVTE